MGVSPVHKDILLEYDWFDDANGCTQHSHRPLATEIQGVHDFFSNAPVSNPDGVNGINVIQDYGQGGLFTGGQRIIDPNNPGALIDGGVSASQYQAYENTYFANNRRGYFHYVLMVHLYNDGNGYLDSSGNATIIGSEMMVAMGCNAQFTTTPVPENTRNAIIHELGHNLGLRHGGDEDCNYKPNYNSTMNYQYEFNGVDANCDGVADNYTPGYSDGSRRTLDENNLNETLGMCYSPIVPVDWNYDGTYSASVSYDINNLAPGESSQCGGTKTILHDYNDWSHLDLAGVSFSLQTLGLSLTRKTDVAPPCAPIPLLKHGGGHGN